MQCFVLQMCFLYVVEHSPAFLISDGASDFSYPGLFALTNLYTAQFLETLLQKWFLKIIVRKAKYILHAEVPSFIFFKNGINLM